MHERCERFPFRYFNISIPLSAICTALYWFPFGVSVPPITHRLFRWVQWVSSVTFATSEIHRNQLHVAVAAGSSRTNFGFVCNFAIVWGISIEKGGKSGHIWGNQSLDAIIDHINSPLLSALVFIFFFCYLEILKTNATPTLDTQWFGGATDRWFAGLVAQCLVSGISNYPKWQAQEAMQTVELSVILSAA